MYEVGDKVIYQGADKSAYKKVGILKSIEEKDGKPQLTVEFEGGETFTAPVDDWSKEFANAARNAKFKVGDTVVVKPGRIMSGETGVVVKVGNYPVSGGVKVDVKMKDGTVVDWTEDDIAANAATNAKFKVGDKVKGTMGASPMGVITKIEKSDSWLGNTCTVKWDDGTTTHPCEGQLMLANSCVSTNSVVRNAIFLLNRKVVKNDAYSDYMKFVNKWRGVVADMERKLQSCKREAPSDATLVVSGQIDDAINEVHTVSQWLENTRYLSREDFEF